MQQPRQKSKLSQKQKINSFRYAKPPSIPFTTRVQQFQKVSPTPYQQPSLSQKNSNLNRKTASNQQRMHQRSPVEFLDEDNFQSFTPQVGISQVSSNGSITPKKRKPKLNTLSHLTNFQALPQSMYSLQGSPQSFPNTLEQIYLGNQQRGVFSNQNTSNNPFINLKKLNIEKNKRKMLFVQQDQNGSKSNQLQKLQQQKEQLQKDLKAAQKIYQMYQKDINSLEQKNFLIKKLKEEYHQQINVVKQLQHQISDSNIEQKTLDSNQKSQNETPCTQKKIQSFTFLEGGSQLVADGLNKLGEKLANFLNNMEQTNKKLKKENSKLSSANQ